MDNEYYETRMSTLRNNLRHRLEVAKAQGNQLLIQEILKEARDLGIEL